MQDPSKQCPRCGQAKAPDDFHRDRQRPDGRTVYCKVCARAKTRQWQADNRERARASSRQWYRENPERARAAMRQWRAENPEQARANRKESKRRWQRANPFHHAARKRLEQTGGGFGTDTVDYAVVLMADPCSYCNSPAGTLDHIDASGENRWTNLTAACARCNTSKRQRPLLLALLNHKEADHA